MPGVSPSRSAQTGESVPAILSEVQVRAAETVADPGEERVDGDEELFRRVAAERLVPEPLVPHGADAAWHLAGVGDPAEDRGDHVAVLEGGGEARALVGVVAQPVEELGEAPLRRVGPAAPFDRRLAALVRHLGDARRLVLGAVVAPEVVVVERLHLVVDRDDGRAGGVEGDGADFLPLDPRRLECAPRGLDERLHVRCVRLRGVVRIVAVALDRILGDAVSDHPLAAVDDRDAHTLRPEVHPGDDPHLRRASGRPTPGSGWWPRAPRRRRARRCRPRGARSR